ncbi:MAG: phage tail tube protein [Desulfurivibrionaceae bacterium]|jgi:hypothetical protein
MSLNNRLTLSREHTIFAVPETTKGTLVFPSAGDLVIPAGNGSIGQAPTYTDSDEIVDSRSLMDQFRDALPAGTWNLPMFMRCGAAGASPQGSALLESLFGVKSVVASTSVTYALSKIIPSFSLWMKQGDAVFFANGATANQVKLAVAKKGAVKFDFSGQFMAMGWCGTDELSAAIDYIATPVTALPVKDAKKYTVGGKIKIGTDDNTGAGYAVTAVNVATNTITISPGCVTDQAIDTVVAPFLPTGTVIGAPVEARTFQVSLDGGVTATKITSLDLTLDNGLQYMEEEVSTEENPTDYVEGERSVKSSLTLLMRRDDLGYFYDGLQPGNEKDVVISFGDDATAGKLAAITMPKARLTVPTISPSAPTVKLNMELTALGTAGEDEISMLIN